MKETNHRVAFIDKIFKEIYIYICKDVVRKVIQHAKGKSTNRHYIYLYVKLLQLRHDYL